MSLEEFSHRDAAAWGQGYGPAPYVDEHPPKSHTTRYRQCVPASGSGWAADLPDDYYAWPCLPDRERLHSRKPLSIFTELQEEPLLEFQQHSTIGFYHPIDTEIGRPPDLPEDYD